MTAPAIAAVISRELRALERELGKYRDEAEVWSLPPGIPNSGGTLALHAAGNLRHFIGGVLGGDSYVRDRDAEFALRGVPRSELVSQLRAAAVAVESTMGRLDPAVLGQPYPLPVANRRINTGEFMLHLTSHLAYHVGQVDFHRRIVTGDASGVGAVSPAELPSAQAIEG
jgi:hypothetical protein